MAHQNKSNELKCLTFKEQIQRGTDFCLFRSHASKPGIPSVFGVIGKVGVRFSEDGDYAGLQSCQGEH